MNPTSSPDDEVQRRSPLDPTAAEIRAMGAAAVEQVARYQEEVRERPVYPRTSAAELEALLAEPLPEEGRDFGRLLEVFDEVLVQKARQNGHPRSLGYVTAPGTAVAAVADFLASGLNANVTAWRSAPAPAQLERVTIGWIKELLGLDPGADGLFTSGGSMANFAALAAARHRVCGEMVEQDGMRALAKPLRIYVQQEAHHSIDKAAAFLGIGHSNVRRVAVDARLRMDVADLERQVLADRAAGAEPFCVVASAGTVVTGAVDPIAEIVAVARRQGLATHVDGAYGGFARMAPSVKHLFAGLEAADSVSLDPHKWMYLPADCGCLVYREPAAARGAFTLGADYTRVMAKDPEEAFAFWDYGPELTRRFRALKVWMALAHVGARAYRAAIEGDLDCARHLAGLVEESADFELMAPVELSIVCFRHLPPGDHAARVRSEVEETRLDHFNEELLIKLQRGGGSYVSNASLGGRFALRACICNYRTTRRDMQTLLEDVRRAAREVASFA